ncbi:uncharacterized protein LOC142178069 [Nicotiana tabacum]|uniref:Uncharacterized protein LOC142178069 n=1 Tax=Nicotiana tabacum TaxID=4097 RepID=A0AC58U215_TOBAC
MNQAQARMKFYSDKRMSDRTLDVGDMVYLKLQPYRQTSVAVRRNLKLSAKYYGPYKITEKIETVAYRFELPSGSQIHPVFHASHLKKCVGLTNSPQQQPPICDADGQVLVQPLAILQRRILKVNNAVGIKVLVQWTNLGADEVT